jgi:diadenosine tetraphosphate (Ap4A) HIT family hydrolase
VRDPTNHTAHARSRSPLLANEHFTLEPCNNCYIPGYLIVMPRQAVESLAQMNSEALASLGPTLAVASTAIEAVVHPQRVYCALFSEETRAVHFHLFPRAEWLTAKYFAAHPHETEISGPRLMDWARQIFQRPIVGMNRNETLEKGSSLAYLAFELCARNRMRIPLGGLSSSTSV